MHGSNFFVDEILFLISLINFQLLYQQIHSLKFRLRQNEQILSLHQPAVQTNNIFFH